MSAQKIVTFCNYLDHFRYFEAIARQSRLEPEKICEEIQRAPQSTNVNI